MTGRLAEGMAAQVEQTLRNIVSILAEAGAEPTAIVRLTWFVTDMKRYRDEVKAIGQGYRRVMGKHFPAMSVIGVHCLVEQDALVEIEATAVLGAMTTEADASLRDDFARDNLPPREQWPDLLLDGLHYPDQLNCVTALLDQPDFRRQRRASVPAVGGRDVDLR